MNELLTIFIDPSNQVYQLILSIFLGIFIGLRREMLLQEKGTDGIMGVRTVSLFVVLGTISTFFEEFSYLPVLIFSGIFIFILIAYYNGVFNLKKIGLTSEISTLLMFWVGVLVGQEKITIAIILTIIIGIFTAYKDNFHSFARNFSMKEWTGALQLIIISAIILPVLPKKAVDIYGVLIPYNIWLLVIFISSIGFIGYFLNKYMEDKKPILMTSFFGSLISSTLVTTDLAIKSKNTSKVDLLVSAIMIAISVMLIRIIAEILLLSNEFNLSFVLPIIIMTVVSFIFSFLFYKKIGKKESSKNIKNLKLDSPFNVLPAIKFALIFIIILYAVFFAEKYFGDWGVYVVVFLSSLVDADAIILSTLESFKNFNSEISVVSRIILIAVIVNTLIKIFYVHLLGSRKFLKKIIVPISIICTSGLITFILY